MPPRRAAQLADPEIVGAEVVAPLADAMRLVDGEERRPDALHQRGGAGRGEALGGHVEELQAAGVEGGEDLLHLGALGLRGEGAGGDAGGAQRADLVAHQRDERRDDEGDAGAGQRRELVAERLAAAGRHDGEDVAAGLDGGDDLLLAGAEVGEAPDLAEQAAGVRHRRAEGGRSSGRSRSSCPHSGAGRDGSSRAAATWLTPSSQTTSPPGATQPPASAEATAFSPSPRP